MKNPICDTVFDTRDLIDYQKDLEEQIIDLWNDKYEDKFITYIDELFETSGYEYAADTQIEYEEFEKENDSLISEYKEITDFCNGLENYAPDFTYGSTVIHEDYFTQYCEELVEDCYDLKDVPDFIKNNINWDGVATDLGVDYSGVKYCGNYYYVR